MSYSCSDFTDDVLACMVELGLIKEGHLDEDPAHNFYVVAEALRTLAGPKPDSAPALSERELATVLAALRYWQREGVGFDHTEDDIALGGGKFDSLNAQEIDGLCERLNSEAPKPLSNPDTDMLAEAVGRHIAWQASGGRMQRVCVYSNARRLDGWAEWMLHYEYADGGKLFVGAIQRSPGAEVEFHS